MLFPAVDPDALQATDEADADEADDESMDAEDEDEVSEDEELLEAA